MARGISIIFVILFHSENAMGLTGYHWSEFAKPFRMPLFFLVSGYLFTPNRYEFSIKKKLSQILRGIVLPYVIFTTIILIPKMLFYKQPISDGLNEILMGWASWFVVSLGGAQIIFSVILQYTKNIKFIFIISIILFCSGIVLHSTHPSPFPFHLTYSLYISIYFALGMIYRLYENKLDNIFKTSWTSVAFLFITYVSLFIFDQNHLHTDLTIFDDRLLTYRHLPLSLLYSIIGILLMVKFLKLVAPINFITEIGKNSLTYYYLNGAVSKGLSTLFIHIPVIVNIKHNAEYALVILTTTLTIFIIYYIVKLIRKRYPIMIGEKKAYANFINQLGIRREYDKDYFSKVISFLRFPMILLVVGIHVPVQLFDESIGFCKLIMDLIPKGVCHIAVPFFFLVSGYLFTKTNLTLQLYKTKLRKRIKTLLIPYLLFNLIACAIIVLPNYKDYDYTLINCLSIFWDTHYSFLHTLGNSPIDYPLWYVRDLMIICLISPIIFWIIKLTYWTLPLICISLWCVDIFQSISGFSLISISFFSLGMYIKYSNINLLGLKRTPVFVLFVVSLAFLLISIFNDNQLFHNLFIISFLFIVFPVSNYIIKRDKTQLSKIVTNLGIYAFFIYGMHALFETKSYNILSGIIRPSNTINTITLYFTTIIVTVAICIGLFKVLFRISPKMTKPFVRQLPNNPSKFSV